MCEAPSIIPPLKVMDEVIKTQELENGRAFVNASTTVVDVIIKQGEVVDANTEREKEQVYKERSTVAKSRSMKREPRESSTLFLWLCVTPKREKECELNRANEAGPTVVEGPTSQNKTPAWQRSLSLNTPRKRSLSLPKRKKSTARDVGQPKILDMYVQKTQARGQIPCKSSEPQN